MTRPKVSICIPTYQQLPFLKKCLDSVIIQTFTDYEIIITDDSPDNSVKNLLKSYDFGEKIVYKKNLVSLGSPMNWNEGLLLAKGEYIKILHHDDWFYDEDSLGDYVDLLEKNPEVSFGFSSCVWVYPDEEKQRKMIPSRKKIKKLRKDASSIFPENFISTPSTIIIRNNDDKLFFDEKIKWLVDSEYYYRCILYGNGFAYSQKPLAKILIEAKHQVTSITRGHRSIEIKEWVYFYNSIRRSSKFSLANFLHLRNVFLNFSIKNQQDLKDCGIPKTGIEINIILLFTRLSHFTKELRTKGFFYLIREKLRSPEGSKRRKIFSSLNFPFKKIRNYVKKKYLFTKTIIAENFNIPQLVTEVNPIIRDFEIDHSSYNYGCRIIIECEKKDVKEIANGRWQINWLDSNNNFVFATVIPFSLHNYKTKYCSPLINRIPHFAKKGLLYLTGHGSKEIYIHSYSFSSYSITNKILHRTLSGRFSKKNTLPKTKKEKGHSDVLFIIPWMSVGGGDMVNLTLSNSLSKQGYNIHFFLSEIAKNEWEKKFRKVTKNIVTLSEIRDKHEHDYFLIDYIKKAQINSIIISNSEFGYKNLPLIKRDFPDLKIFDILHGQGGSREGGGFPEYSKPYDKFLDKRITINNYLKKYMIDKYCINSDKINVIHNGIDTDRYKQNNQSERKSFNISYIGRLSYEKHPEKIIEIAECFLKKAESKSVCFQIIGDGLLYKDLKDEIEQKSLDKYFQLKGYRDNIKKELENTDVLVLCSEMEGLPIVLLEAMSMSIPCIATRVGGIPELIQDGENGFLIDFSPKMAYEFAEKIELLYGNLSLRTFIGKNARKKVVNEFSILNMTREYVKILNEN